MGVADSKEHGTRSDQEKGASVAWERAGGIAQGERIQLVTMGRIKDEASPCRELIHPTTNWECRCTPSNRLALNYSSNLLGCAEHE